MPSELALCSLASGSSGNCLVLRGPEGLLLLDAGLSGREIRRRLEQAEADPCEIRALLLSHAHSDHTSGAGVIARSLGIPVYGSKGTLAGCAHRFRGSEQLQVIRAGEKLALAGLRITPFAVPHDCREPLMFRVEGPSASLAVCTDTGRPDPALLSHLHGVELLLLESNYDAEMLRRGPYPARLKARIRGGRGHLSNDQAAGLLGELTHAGLRQVLLGHLSENNNCPRKVFESGRRALEEAGRADLPLEVLRRHSISDWFHLAAGESAAGESGNGSRLQAEANGQLPLFPR